MEKNKKRPRWNSATAESVKKVHDLLVGSLELVGPVLRSMTENGDDKTEVFDGGLQGPELADVLIDWCAKLAAAYARRPRTAAKEIPAIVKIPASNANRLPSSRKTPPS